MTTRLQVTGGSIDITLSGGATIISGANGSADVTVHGSIADINATLASLVYTGGVDLVGTAADTLTVTTNDLGNMGSGGALTDLHAAQVNARRHILIDGHFANECPAIVRIVVDRVNVDVDVSESYVASATDARVSVVIDGNCD